MANNLDPDFGESEEVIFCARFTCNVEADIDIAPDNGNGGVIIATATNGVSPFEYSIDGGVTFQASNIFNNLTAGNYEIIVMDFNQCTYSEMVEIEACTGTIDFEVNYPLGSDSTAWVYIITTDIDSVIGYSLDGGTTFQASNEFPNVPDGEYNAVVQAANGCVYTGSVIVIGSSSTIETNELQSVRVYPNPTEDEFMLEIANANFNEVFLGVKIYDINGRCVQRSQITRYNDLYKGMINLYNYPQGQYFIKIDHPEINKLYRINRL